MLRKVKTRRLDDNLTFWIKSRYKAKRGYFKDVSNKNALMMDKENHPIKSMP